MSGVHLGPVGGGCRALGGETQEVCAGVVVTFDLVLREEGSVEAVVVAGVDVTADDVVVGTTAGVAVMLVVAAVTPSVEAADC